MPQVIAGDGNNRDLHTDDDEDSDRDRPELELPPDFPPESFCLSGDAELDWFDRNALFERKDSTKGSVSNSGNLNPSLFDSSSQRFSRNLKPRASIIIGLPKPCFADLKHRRSCKPVKNTHLSPRRSGSGTEPSSPKVSCMGRVRSRRDRSRRSRNRKHRSFTPEPERSKPAGKPKTGLFSTLRAMFRVPRGKGREGEADAPPREVDAHDIMNRLPASDVDAPPGKGVAGGSPPDLGGVRRFASGRRSESWG